MAIGRFQYIFGPVYSWRLGISLGIDPISPADKTCNFDCVYCQLGKTVHREGERKIFVPTENILSEIRALPKLTIDYLTFTSRGEPTLAKNLGEIIRALRSLRKEKIVVITNSSLINHADVQSDLCLADFVLAKLDASSPEILQAVNRPRDVQFQNILQGLKKFKTVFKGRLALQIMFINENKAYAKDIADLARSIAPDEVQLDTPLRPCGVKPLSKNEMKKIGNYFQGMPTISVYDKRPEIVKPLNEIDTVRRHGEYK